jgi:hypothetical protein
MTWHEQCVFYVTYNKGVGSGFCDVYNAYRIMTKRPLPKIENK